MSLALRMAHLSKIWTKNTAIIAGFVGFIGLALYPVVVSPAINPRKWQAVQKETRKDLDQHDIQPGGMRIWSDPFAPRLDQSTGTPRKRTP